MSDRQQFIEHLELCSKTTATWAEWKRNLFGKLETAGAIDLSTKYGTGGKPHHIWCNFATRNGKCRQCDGLYSKYPYEEGEDPQQASDRMIKQHFPNVIKR